MANANITATTRDLWRRTVRHMVFLQLPLYAALLEKRRVRWKSGVNIKATVQYQEMDSLAQEYASTQALTSSTKTLWATNYWAWKKVQLPISYGVDEFLQNDGSRDTSPVNLIPNLIKAGQRGMRLKLNAMGYDMYSSTTDADAGFQSIPDALEHARTYGNRTSSTTAYTWWNGASLTGAWTDRNTNISPTIKNFRDCMDVITRYPDKPIKNGDIVVLCGSSIFRKYQAEVESRHFYDREGSSLAAKYGFTGFSVDGVQFIKDSYLDTDPESGTTTVGDLASEWMFILNVNDWELRIHPRRNMKLTRLVWQAEQSGGKDEWLARVMLAGNLVCHKPNGSMWKSYVL